MPRGRRNATRDEPHTRLALIWFTETRAAAQLRGRRPDTHPMVSLTKGITSKGIVRPKVLLTKGIAGFSQKVSSAQCHPKQQGAAFICVAHSAQGPAVRRLCASAPARWLSRHAHYNLKHHPSVPGGGLDKATTGDRAFGKRLLSPVGSSALSKPRNVASR